MSVNATVVNDTRYMMQFRFWLDGKKDLESWLADECAKLKSLRQFQTVVRNALRLYLSLQAGQLDVLLELFPFAVNMPPQPSFAPQRPLQPASAAPEIELEIKISKGGKSNANENFLRSMANLLGYDPSVYGLGAAGSTGNAKPIKGANVELAAPNYDDLDLI